MFEVALTSFCNPFSHLIRPGTMVLTRPYSYGVKEEAYLLLGLIGLTKREGAKSERLGAGGGNKDIHLLKV